MNSLENRIYNTTLSYIGYGIVQIKSTREIDKYLSDILPIFHKENGVYDIQIIRAHLYDFYGF